MSSCPGKSSWPELVGTNGGAAKVIIERQNGRVTATVLKEGSVVTGDFRCDRVRIFVNNQQIVTQVPQIG